MDSEFLETKKIDFIRDLLFEAHLKRGETRREYLLDAFKRLSGLLKEMGIEGDEGGGHNQQFKGSKKDGKALSSCHLATRSIGNTYGYTFERSASIDADTHSPADIEWGIIAV